MRPFPHRLGVVNTVSGPGEVGAWLVSDPGVNKIMFTGSTVTGKRIAEAAARNMVPVTMELGGNDAAIVLPDADPKVMAMGLFWGAFINMGQTCACAKRLYVHESLFDQTVQALKEIAQAVPMGNGMQDGMQDGMVMGPIQNKMQYDKVISLMESAKQAGATIVCGGTAPAGPVLPIIKYSNIDDAVASANRLSAGLGASVWSSDVEPATHSWTSTFAPVQ